MDLEPHLIKTQSADLDHLLFSQETDQPFPDYEDPYSFNSTSTSLIGLAIEFVILAVTFLAIIS